MRRVGGRRRTPWPSPDSTSEVENGFALTPHGPPPEEMRPRCQRRKMAGDESMTADGSSEAGPDRDGVATRLRLATPPPARRAARRSEEHTSELQSRGHIVCRLLLEK